MSEDRSGERKNPDKQANDYAGDDHPPCSCDRRSLLKRPPARAIDAIDANGHAGAGASDRPEVMLGRRCREVGSDDAGLAERVVSGPAQPDQRSKPAPTGQRCPNDNSRPGDR